MLSRSLSVGSISSHPSGYWSLLVRTLGIAAVLLLLLLLLLLFLPPSNKYKFLKCPHHIIYILYITHVRSYLKYVFLQIPRQPLFFVFERKRMMTGMMNDERKWGQWWTVAEIDQIEKVITLSSQSTLKFYIIIPMFEYHLWAQKREIFKLCLGQSIRNG